MDNYVTSATGAGVDVRAISRDPDSGAEHGDFGELERAPKSRGLDRARRHAGRGARDVNRCARAEAGHAHVDGRFRNRTNNRNFALKMATPGRAQKR